MVVAREKNSIEKARSCGEAEKAIGVRGCGCLHEYVRMASWVRRVRNGASTHSRRASDVNIYSHRRLR